MHSKANVCLCVCDTESGRVRKKAIVQGRYILFIMSEHATWISNKIVSSVISAYY